MGKYLTFGKEKIFTADCFDKIKTRGRPKLKLNEKGVAIVEKLASVMCTEEEVANFLDVTVEVLHNDVNHITFLETLKKGYDSGKASLRRNQFLLSKTNATMAIWLGKQYLNQKDVLKGDGIDLNEQKKEDEHGDEILKYLKGRKVEGFDDEDEIQ